MTATSSTVLSEIDAELGELRKRHSRCTGLVARCLLEIASIETEADVLLEARAALLDDGR